MAVEGIVEGKAAASSRASEEFEGIAAGIVEGAERGTSHERRASAAERSVFAQGGRSGSTVVRSPVLSVDKSDEV